jgi:hypothetical protein
LFQKDFIQKNKSFLPVVTMVGKMGETCPQCKQFRMLCMCAVTSDRDRKGRMGRRTSTEKALAFAQSLAIWRGRSRRPRPSREPSLRTLTQSPTIPAGKLNLFVTFDNLSQKQ